MATIEIYGDIGDSWWMEESITGKSIANQLREIPEEEPIDLRINSLGGDVGEALAIYNLLKDRGNITTYVDGYALSAASFVALAGDRIIAPRSSIVMIHNPHTIEWGDATAMRKCADMLDTHRDATLGIYVEASGKTSEEIIALLDAETWMTGDEAKELGFVDEVTDEKPVENKFPSRVQCSAKDKRRFKRMGWKFESVAASARKPPLKGGIKMAKVDEDNTPDVLQLQTQMTALQATVDKLTAESAAKDEQIAQTGRKLSVTNQYSQFRATAMQLQSELKLSPNEFDLLFKGDRFSVDALLASPKCEYHLGYLEERLEEIGGRSPGLQTEFEVKDSINDFSELPNPIAVRRYGANLSQESAKDDARIRAKAKEMGGNPDSSDDYLEAMNALGLTY
jgi:ATP-dependent protease ClpP protease subunit